MTDSLLYHIKIGPEHVGKMIKSILLSDAKMSRRLVRHLAQTNGVERNGDPTYLTARVVLGDEIYVMLPGEQSPVLPEPMDLDVRYEDSEFIVINKAPGILTHPTARERTGSLLAGVRSYLGGGLVPHCVHRLDRDTSGLVIFAKHTHAHQLLDRALRQGQVHRVYHALATGFSTDEGALENVVIRENPIPPGLETNASRVAWQTIDLPIAQDPERPSRRVIDAQGQRAITHYRVIETRGGVALLQIVLETGRTHQIRLHLATTGHSLLGERDYHERRGCDWGGGPNNLADESWGPHGIEQRELPRHALHAAQLAWRHPVSGETHLVVAEPPTDIRDAWAHILGRPFDWVNLLQDPSALLGFYGTLL